jgi:NAD(P)H-dependent flavin oxidoreductase YrpB (nitropropane dioxygenase family)
MLQTPFTRDYGVELPIISAGMAFVARAPLAAAVSGAGAFGTLGATAMPVELLEQELAEIRAATDRPFGVNLIPRFAADEHVALCAERRVPVATFFWDEPGPGWIDTLKDAGTRVWVQIAGAEQAAAAVAAGADAVVAQGWEAGGHNLGGAGTMALVPVVCDAVAPVPVFAAGGIADGRGVAAALALGADAAVLGTRFVAAVEADAHPDYQERIVAAGAGDTARHGIFGFDFPDAAVRGLRNRIVAEFEGRDDPAPYAGLDPDDQPVVGTASVFGQEMPLARFTGLPPTRATTGDLDEMSLLAGQSSGLVDGVRPAADIVRDIAAGAEAALRRLTFAA